MAVTGQSMNSNSAVFGLCNPESGYGSPGQGYPSVTSEHLSAFYAGSGGSSAPGSGGSSSGGGGGSSGEPSSPSPYGSGGGGGLHSERHHGTAEPKYEPSHSPSSGKEIKTG